MKSVLPILGALSALVLAFPDLGIYAAISIIGIPIAIIYWAIPAIFLITLISFYAYLFISLKGAKGVILSICVCGAILAIPPFFLNQYIEKQALSITQDDQNNLKLPIQVEKIAVRRRYPYAGVRKRGITACDGFCIHALLTGVAESILLFETKDPHQRLNPNAEATEFTLEKLPQCPATKFTPGHHSLRLPQDKNSLGRGAADAIAAIKLRISEGECLVSRTKRLSDADLVISIGRAIPYKRLKPGSGFSLLRDTINADRITVYQKTEDEKSFVENYRWTGVRYQSFAPILLPAPLSISTWKYEMGWFRNGEKMNIATKYYEKPNWPEFLTKTLGFELHLDNDDIKKRSLEIAKKILAENRSPTRDEWNSISEYFDGLGLRRIGKMTQHDFELAYQILNDSKFPPPPRLYSIVDYSKQHSSQAVMTNLANIMLVRIEQILANPDQFNKSIRMDLSNLASGVSRMPNKDIIPHFVRHKKLMDSNLIKTHAKSLITKFHIHGERAVPTLLEQIKFGLRGGRQFFRENGYQHPYLAAMYGLCLAGEKANSGLPTMLKLAQERLPAFASYGDLMVQTLVRLGADPNDLWPIYSKANANKERKSFDREVRIARSNDPNCYF